MFLCDRDLRLLLQLIRFEHEDGASPFDATEQVQPASIDLRLSAVFWRPRRRFTLDLRRARLLEISPRRYYQKVVVGDGETIILRPNELLLGRTLEEFSIPNGYTAELVGRSSFARLGIMIHATGGFINPGWRGRMPLQLVNLGPNSVRLVPGLPICQLRLARLTADAEHPYGDPVVQSTYANDDGGPSYWWRDKRIKKLHAALAEKSVEGRIQAQLDVVIGSQEPEVIERLEQFVASTRTADLTNADAMLDDFAKREDRRRTRRKVLIYVARASFTVGISTGLWVANKLPLAWWHFAVWAADLATLALSVYAFRTEVGDHFGESELRARRQPKATR